jgi:adenylate cyclase
MTRLRDLLRFQGAPRVRMPRWVDRIISAGIVSSDPQVVRRHRITNVAALAGAFNASSRFVANLFYDPQNFLLMEIIFAALAVTALFIHRLHRFGDNAAAWVLTFWFISGVSSSAIFYGLQAQAHVYFVLAGIVWVVFGLENWRQALVAVGLLCTATFLIMAFTPQQGIAVITDQKAISFLATQSIINSVLINAAVLCYALVVLYRTEQDLESESARADALLSVVLPETVAGRLRADPQARIADRLDGLTVLFADLVGFTRAAHDQPPEAVVAYLDDTVRAFELLCETHGVEKIKTIGDSFMAVGGLGGSERSGAVGIARVALAMREAQGLRLALGGRELDFRIGIHVGSAVAGVIGETRIAYDLWGDAVNTASRMESHGVPGRIQVSEQYRTLLGDEFSFEERGTTDIKGIGCTRTFFLLGPRAGEGT